MNQRNYQKEMDNFIKNNCQHQKPKLLLHACCAPCSSSVLEKLADFFQIGIYFYNPNIAPPKEYTFRKEELRELIKQLGLTDQIEWIDSDYDSGEFYSMTKGMEKIPEGGERCIVCFRLRLEASAKKAKELGYPLFATTLTISPLKNVDKINEIGEEIAKRYQLEWLPSNFKKKNGYLRSIELSKEFGLYRQDYCGCIYSKNARYLEQEGQD